MSYVKWVCDECFSEMKVEKEDTDRNRIYCPSCGNQWYVDDEDEYINDNSTKHTDFEYDLANFTHGGDLPESSEDYDYDIDADDEDEDY